MTEKVDVNGADRHPVYAELVRTPDQTGAAGDSSVASCVSTGPPSAVSAASRRACSLTSGSRSDTRPRICKWIGPATSQPSACKANGFATC